MSTNATTRNISAYMLLYKEDFFQQQQIFSLFVLVGSQLIEKDLDFYPGNLDKCSPIK